MKLIAEIQTLASEGEIDRHDSYPVRLSVQDGVLAIEARRGVEVLEFALSFDEVQRALAAIAGPSRAAMASNPMLNFAAQQNYAPDLAAQMRNVAALNQSAFVANPYARNPDGSRNGPSPRDNMRARKPEANVEMPEEETAA